MRGRFAPRVPSLYPFQTQPKGKKERKYHVSLAPSVKVPKFMVSIFSFSFRFRFRSVRCRNVGNSPPCIRRNPTLHLTVYGGVDGWEDPQVCRPTEVQEGGEKEEFVVFVSVFKSPGKRWIHVMLEIDMWGVRVGTCLSRFVGYHIAGRAAAESVEGRDIPTCGEGRSHCAESWGVYDMRDSGRWMSLAQGWVLGC